MIIFQVEQLKQYIGSREKVEVAEAEHLDLLQIPAKVHCKSKIIIKNKR